MRLLLIALRFLTIFPWPRGLAFGPEEVARSTPFFPIVGALIGLVLVLLNQLLDPYLASEVLSVALVTVLVLMTRAAPLTGLGKTFDALIQKGEAGTATDSLEDNRAGFAAVIAVLMVVMFKVRAIEVMGEARNQGLLLAPTLGCWAMSVLAYGSHSAQTEQKGMAMEEVKGRHIAMATVLTVALVIFFSGREGLWITLWVSLSTILIRAYLYRRQGGLTRHSLGMASDLNETLALVLFASL